MTQPSTTYVLEVTSVALGGRGLGRLDGKVCFVPGVLPGESVEIRVLKDRGHFLEATPLKRLTSSPDRITPACPLAFQVPLESPKSPQHLTLPEHFPTPESLPPACPGCCYQHVAYETELLLKNQQLLSVLGQLGGEAAPPLLPPVPAPQPLGYRNKLTLHAQFDGSDRWLGYFMDDNHTVLDIPQCPLAVAPINEALQTLRADPSFRHTLRPDMTIVLRWTPRDGAQWWRNQASEKESWLVESSILGPISVPRNSFYQMNPPMADLLIAAVKDHLKADPCDAVIDLYCGVGIFALAAAQLGIPRVIGIDQDGPGIKAAGYNATRLGLTSIQWLTQPAEKGFAKFKPGLSGKTTLIVDPPRTGLGRRLVQDIIALNPSRILYISCGPDTMARDVAWLREGGYQLLSAQLFDMFPRTAHFESLVVLGQ